MNYSKHFKDRVEAAEMLAPYIKPGSLDSIFEKMDLYIVAICNNDCIRFIKETEESELAETAEVILPNNRIAVVADIAW